MDTHKKDQLEAEAIKHLLESEKSLAEAVSISRTISLDDLPETQKQDLMKKFKDAETKLSEVRATLGAILKR